ncbi:DUF4197 domain-containing protein [Thiomicrorhabdus arctica]|uniref:DUF4197 domain-containing protein n=1 Tax=Thiomicrorhabdus arctica TaxID=131540 RepID=UPI0003811984|nr:DUF4197 domain-containing protein [Thiomicrorhabdus arctica]
MNKFSKNTFIVPILISFSGIIGLSSVSVSAQASWWDQGADLLKNIPGVSEAVKTPTTTLPNNLSVDELQKAFKQALTKGSETVVSKLSLKDGFNTDPKIHIPLPSSLKTVQSTLNQFGMGRYMDDLELKINRAAEAATPQAEALFLQAIQAMSFDDVKKIYKGPKDSATQYLKSKTAPSLKTKMAPIVEKSLNEVGAITAYDTAISKYKDLPFVPNVKADLLDHVVNQGMEGIFYYLAQEEASIRKDPVKQSTELLKKVFGKN